ncbi:hypothetical protein ACFQ61_02170 [Streptomyces sp. NPDC056500]|uniref:hypothetical protein n=1 Tax=Streptomyces sp. NPDC056500 TaxID=3345840 RepID=UPI00367B142C
MAFPETALGLRAELEIGGERVDVTRRVYTRDPITIVQGMSSEGTRVDPSTCNLTLNNRDGRFSPRNPMGPYYGLIGRNTPLHISVPLGESYLSVHGGSAYASTPDDPTLDITAVIDIRAEVRVDWSGPVARWLVAKWDETITAGRSYGIWAQESRLFILWSVDGTDDGIRHAWFQLPPLPRRAALRVTLDTTGGSWTARGYWAPTMDGPWEPAGDTVTGTGSHPIHVSTAPLTVGMPAQGVPAGRMYRAAVRSGTAATVVAAPDFRTAPEGTASFTDGAGRVWTVQDQARVSAREPLFTGEIASLPSRWGPGGHDVWVPAEAAGILRRLQQGRKPVDSTLRRRIPSERSCVAYWPMEDGAAATQAYSPIAGVAPMLTTGLAYAADESLIGSAPLPTLSGATLAMTARVPPHAATGRWMISHVYHLAAAPAVDTMFMEFTTTGTARRITVLLTSLGVRFRGYAADGSELFHLYVVTPNFYGRWNRLEVLARPAGTSGQITYHLGWIGAMPGDSAHAYTETITGTVGTVSRIDTRWGPALEGMTIGHLGVFNSADTQIYTGAAHAFTGESALQRLGRLAMEESAVPLTTTDGDTTRASELMGPQSRATLLELIEEAAALDGGILAERPDHLGLWYRDRTSLENQVPQLALTYGQLAPPIEPVEDDQHVRNDVTVQRPGGSSGHVVIEDGPLGTAPPELGGVGIYDTSTTVNAYSDDRTIHIAGWQAHLGTWDEARYPSIRIQLHRHPELIPAVLGLRIGDLIRITGLPLYAGAGGEDVELHLQQITHVPRPRAWDVTLVCTPAGPWRVGVVDSPTHGRLDTEGAELFAPVGAADTQLWVTTTTGPEWVTDPIHHPLDVRMGGEVMTATSITGLAEDQFARHLVTGWGTATSGQAWTTTGGAAADYSVQGV